MLLGGTDLSLQGNGQRFRERYNLKNDPFLLCVGRIDHGKGSLEAFEYFVAYKKRNPSNLKFVIVGDSMIPPPRSSRRYKYGICSRRRKVGYYRCLYYLSSTFLF